MGYGGYYGYSFANIYPYGLGWGFPSGYDGYYSSWTGPYHHRYYRHANRAHCPGHAGCRRNNRDDRDDVNDRIAREDPVDRRHRDGSDDEDEGSDSSSERKIARNRQAPVGRYGTQDRVIRNNDKTKTVKSRLEPSVSVPVKNVNVSPSPSGITVHRSVPSSPRTSSSGRSRSAPASSSPSRRSAGQVRSSRRKDGD